MKEQLVSVQRFFWILLTCSALLAAAAAPLGGDGQLMKAMRELRGFYQGFERGKLEAFLFESASQQGEVALPAIAELANRSRKDLLSLADQATPVGPLAGVQLATLAAVNAFCGAKASVKIGSPRPQQIADSLVWRLPRLKDGAAYELRKVELLPVPMGTADVELEQKVVAARKTARERRKAYLKARRLREKADARFVMLRKRRAHWRPMLKAKKKRDQARAEMDAGKGELEQAEAEYEKLASRARKFEASGASAEAPAGFARRAAAVVTLRRPGSDQPLQVVFPLSLAVRAVPVPPLRGCDFAATKSAGVWEQVAGLDAERAIARIEAKFSWHYGAVGKAFLQLAPVLLLYLVGILFMRIRKAAASYNPFDKMNGQGELPRVGLKPAQLNLLGIVALPFLGCALCAWSLMQINAIPAAPILSALLVLGLGAVCFVRMNDLSSLRDAVNRSRRTSQAPPVS